MEFFGKIAVRFRYLVVLIWVGVTILCVITLPSLGSVINSDNSSFLPSDTPTLHALQLARPFQATGGSTAVLVASRKEGALSTASRSDDQTIFANLLSSLNGTAYLKDIRDQGISSDGAAHKALLEFGIGTNSPEAENVINSIRAKLTASTLPAGLNLNLTGQLASAVDNNVASAQAQRLTQFLSNAVILIMLFIVYRAALAPFITLLPAVVVLVLSGPVIAGLANLGLFQVSGVTQAILTILVLGAGTDYGLFLTLRMHEEMRRGLTPQAAVVEAVAKVGESISFSAGTIIAAMLSLLLASFGIYRGLGPSLAIGMGLMLLAGLTLLPSLLAIFGQWLFWPTKLDPKATEKPGAWGELAVKVVEHPVITLISGFILFGGLTVATLGYAPAGFGGSSSGPVGYDSAIGSTAIAAHYPPAIVNPTTVLLQFPGSVWNDLGKVQEAEQAFEKANVFRSVSGPLNPNGTPITVAQLQTLYAQLGMPHTLAATPPASSPIPAQTYNAYRSLAQFISPDGKTVAFYTTLTAGDPSSTLAQKAVPEIRNAISQVAVTVGATDNGVSGAAAVAYDVSAASDADLIRIVPVVMALIAVLLGLVMRSLIAPIYLVLSVALSFGASFGLAVIIFMLLGGQAGLNFVLPFLMFVFLMALGEDYNILVMSRIREEAHKFSLHTAIADALNATGTTVTSAGLILAATFAVSGIFGATDQIRQLGTSIAIGVLLDTFLVRTLLVPSVVALLGRWNWWPSALFRQVPPQPTNNKMEPKQVTAAE
ncbi:MAG: MMPL family transporter [Chloroflexi bacterium]|nr:MMPL family transporter [Chloroflexota bacterium]